jgi:hypothetical protein
MMFTFSVLHFTQSSVKRQRRFRLWYLNNFNLFPPLSRWCYIHYKAWKEITFLSSVALVSHFLCLTPGMINTAWRSYSVRSVLLQHWYPTIPLSSLSVGERLHSVNRIRHEKQNVMTTVIFIHSTNTFVKTLPEMLEVRNPYPLQSNLSYLFPTVLSLSLVKFI